MNSTEIIGVIKPLLEAIQKTEIGDAKSAEKHLRAAKHRLHNIPIRYIDDGGGKRGGGPPPPPRKK